MTDALPGLRARSQLLDPADVDTRSPAAVVRWFGALQAQDPRAAVWAVGLRARSTRPEVVDALGSGQVVRTWPMRGTLHLVPGEDARWMVEHLGARALARAARRREELGLTDRDVALAGEVLAEALRGGASLTRAECTALLSDAGVPTQGQCAYHLLSATCHRGICCLGPDRGREQTFVLLAEWVPDSLALDRPTALATIAERFVRSHGPVTVADLARWADLTLTEARATLATAPGVVHRRFAGIEMHVSEALLDTTPHGSEAPGSAHALPAFDELVIGYRDRTAQLAAADEARVVPGGNGVFSAVLVLDGRVVGTWRRAPSSQGLTATAFRPLSSSQVAALSEALGRLAAFEGLPARIRWHEPGEAERAPG